MIYAVRDRISEVAVPFSGKRLFCRQGKLYFLLDTDADTPIEGAQNGNILSYDPVTGEIHVIVDDVFDTITVYQDCILCAKVNIEGTVVHTESWFYFFDTGKLFAAENNSPSSFILHGVRYGDYFLVKDYDSNPYRMMLCHWDNSETIPLDVSPVAYYFYIKGDNLIWFEKEGIHFWNIPSNEEKIIEINRKQEGAYSFFYNNYFYTGRGSYIDVENGISQKCYPMFSDGAGSEISEFCTDGERIYGFASTIDDMYSQGLKQHLCSIEWRSMDDLFSIFAEDEEKLFKFSITESSFGPFDGILLLTPVDQLFQ